MKSSSEILRAFRPKTRFGKFSFVVVCADLLIRLLGTLYSPSRHVLPLLNLALFVVIARYVFKLMRWAMKKLLWRLRRRLIITYLLVGVVPVILLLSIMGILGYAFFGQLTTYWFSSDIERLGNRLVAAGRALAGPLLDSMATSGTASEGWKNEFSDLLGELGNSFPLILIDAREGPAHASLEVRHGRFLERRENARFPQWIKEDVHGLFEENSRLYFASVIRQTHNGNAGWVWVRAPFDDEVLRRLSEENQASLSILTLVPAPPTLPRNSIRLSVGKRQYVQTEIREVVDSKTAAQFTQKLAWYDSPTRFPFFPPAARRWQTGETLNSIQWMYLLNSTWMRQARRLFSKGFVGEENVIVVALVAISVFFLVIEAVALLSSLLMTRTITGTVHNLDQGAQHIMRGDFSHRIRVKSGDQLSMLAETFNTMTASIEKLLKEQAEKQRLESELAIALEVQRQLLPREAPRLDSLKIAGVCNPARIVSGDYYDYLVIAPTAVGLALGDVSGKGVSAALLMASLQAALRSHSDVFGLPLALSANESPQEKGAGAVISSRVAEIVSLLNQQLYHNTPSEKYVTFFYGVYDEWQRRLTYTNAGHLPPLVFDGSNVRRLEAGGTVLGLIPNVPYDQGEIHLAPKDTLVAYTDGITEAENSFGEQFGEGRLINTVQRNLEKSADEIVTSIISAVSEWAEFGEAQDDMTLIVAKSV